MTYLRYRDHEQPGRAPRPRVVFLPGTMGSVLVKTDARLPVARVIWGTRLGMLRFRSEPALLMRGNGLNRHGAVATDMPPRETKGGLVELPPQPPGLVPYKEFIERLESVADLLVFPYDWRLSCDESALELERAIRARWFPGSPVAIPREDRISIVAHSMGGLVSRNSIEGRNGYRFTQRLITVGTPHQGAPTAYTHFLGKTSALRPVLVPLPVQLALLNFCASAFQLLPNYDFVLRGGAIEPRATTYAKMPAHPTGTSVAAVIRLLRDGLYPGPSQPSLNAFLAAKRVEYHCLGSTGNSTVFAYDASTGSVQRNLEGDGTVPLISALCPDGAVSLRGGLCYQSSNIRHHRFWGPVHEDLFRDRAVQDRCFSLLGITPPPTREAEGELLEEGELVEIERELEMALEAHF